MTREEAGRSVGLRNVGSRNGGAKLDATKAELIRWKFKAGVGRLTLAKEYGVSRDTIDDVLRGKRWARCRLCGGHGVVDSGGHEAECQCTGA